MKPTTDVYLNKVSHLARSWGVTRTVKKGMNKKKLKMSQKTGFLAQFDRFLILQ